MVEGKKRETRGNALSRGGARLNRIELYFTMADPRTLVTIASYAPLVHTQVSFWQLHSNSNGSRRN
jgi:hypothetical protein